MKYIDTSKDQLRNEQLRINKKIIHKPNFNGTIKNKS